MASARLPIGPRETRLLDGYRLNPRRSFVGRVRGERLSKKKGLSIEFADYREYAEGDDLRHLDWNVLARLEHPVLRTYKDEEDLAVHVLLDTSPSMDFGEPTKFAAALSMAAAVGYLALTGVDALYPIALGSRSQPMGALRSRASISRFASWLGSLHALPGNGISSAIRTFVASGARAGLCVIISDGLDPDLPAAIRLLSGRGHECSLIQVLSPEEIDPDLEGDLKLIDAEGGEAREITASANVLAAYKQNLKAHNDALSSVCSRYGGRYLLVQSDSTTEASLLRMRRDGWFAR